jgi:hypothetical protein
MAVALARRLDIVRSIEEFAVPDFSMVRGLTLLWPEQSGKSSGAERLKECCSHSKPQYF